jgi:hypothetical protein
MRQTCALLAPLAIFAVDVIILPILTIVGFLDTSSAILYALIFLLVVSFFLLSGMRWKYIHETSFEKSPPADAGCCGMCTEDGSGCQWCGHSCCGSCRRRLWWSLSFSAIALFAVGLFCFIHYAVSDKNESPAHSRNHNGDCASGDFDWHDIWHLLSGFALFLFGFAFYYTNPPQPDWHKVAQVSGADATVVRPQSARIESVEFKVEM